MLENKHTSRVPVWLFVSHLHCMRKTARGRYRDVPPMIVLNSVRVLSSLAGAGRRQILSLGFLLALVHNSPIIHPASRGNTDLQGGGGKRPDRSGPDDAERRADEQDAPPGLIGSRFRCQGWDGVPRTLARTRMYVLSPLVVSVSALVEVEMEVGAGCAARRRAGRRSAESAAPRPRRALHRHMAT